MPIEVYALERSECFVEPGLIVHPYDSGYGERTWYAGLDGNERGATIRQVCGRLELWVYQSHMAITSHGDRGHVRLWREVPLPEGCGPLSTDEAISRLNLIAVTRRKSSEQEYVEQARASLGMSLEGMISDNDPPKRNAWSAFGSNVRALPEYT